jgi:hypothetical protein
MTYTPRRLKPQTKGGIALKLIGLPIIAASFVMIFFGVFAPDFISNSAVVDGKLTYEFHGKGSHSPEAVAAYCSNLHLRQMTPELDALADQQLAVDYKESCDAVPAPEGSVR